MQNSDSVVKERKRTSLKFRIFSSIVGALIGVFIPAFYLIGNENNIDLQRYTSKGLGHSFSTMSVLLFVPCFFCTFILFPWLYKKLKVYLDENKKLPIYKHILFGSIFGIMATFLTPFLFGLFLAVFSPENFISSILHSLWLSLFLGFTAGIYFLPLTIFFGTLYSWGNYVFIKRFKLY